MKKVLCLLILCISMLLFGCTKNNDSPSTPSNNNEENNEENPNNDEEPSFNHIVLSFSHQSGFYDNSFNLKIEADHESEIYYTIDGSNPSKESIKYNSEITIDNKSIQENRISNVQGISSLENIYYPGFNVDKYTIIRIKAYDDYGNETDTQTLVFFVGLETKYYENIPIVCIETDYDNLFNYETGIYVLGKTYDENEDKSGYPEPLPANYNNTGKDWERESAIIYFDNNHSEVFEQNCGIRIHGGWTRAFNQKSFNLYARKDYGSKKFEGELFEGINPKTFMLRSGGYRDSLITKVRDGMIQNLCSNLGFEKQTNYPCILFLNGEYWGIYSLQERFADTTIEEHYGIDKDNVIIVEKDELDEGKEEDMLLYDEMLSFFKNNDLSINENYQLASDIIDIDSFINYMCIELFISNIDWPNNNFRMWRSRDIGDNKYEDGKWRFMMYDTDDSCDIISKCSVQSNPFLNVTHWANGPLDDRCTIGLIFTSLLKNETFKEEFRKAFNNIMENILSYEQVSAYLDEQVELLSVPMEHFYQRFVSNDAEAYNSDYFKSEIEKIKEFFKDRPSYMAQYLDEVLSN